MPINLSSRVFSVLDVFFMKSSLIKLVRAENNRLVKIVVILGLGTLVLIDVASLINCIVHNSPVLIWILSFQLVIVSLVFYLSLKKYKLYMGYVFIYGALFLNLVSEFYGIYMNLYPEQRMLFTNSVLIILIFLSTLLIDPRHVILIGFISVVRILCFNCFYDWRFSSTTLYYHLIIFSALSFFVFYSAKKTYILIYQSIIQRKIIDQKNQQLSQLIAFKQDMISTILHDIRNPLNNIVFAVEQNHPSSYVLQSVQNILQIADSFIDLHRMEEGAVVLQASYQNVYQTIRSAIEQVNYLLREKNNFISLNIPSSLYLNIDHRLIERVFTNILTNSIKHAKPNSSIIFNCEYSSEHIRFEIGNNGKPIHPDDIEHVFNKFVSKDGALQTNYSSKGLGLRFCKMVLDAHGGDIGFITNYPKNGTRMWFTLPHYGNYLADTETKEKILTPSEPIKLTQTEKELLRPYIVELCKCQIYETGLVMKILNSICTPTESPSVEHWKEELLNAVLADNKEYFQKLTSL